MQGVCGSRVRIVLLITINNINNRTTITVKYNRYNNNSRKFYNDVTNQLRISQFPPVKFMSLVTMAFEVYEFW